MKTVHEVSKITGVSVRTLHHYDSIGLLKPAQTTKAGYRLYDDTSLSRLQTILLFRELEFPLKEIKRIIDSPGFDRRAALKQQIKLLELRRKRLDEMIDSAREIIKTGVDNMDFSAFDKTEIEKYAAEAKQKWGGTQAYKECAQKTVNQTDAQNRANVRDLMQIFAGMGKSKGFAPDCAEAQREVETLRQFITEHFYNCTPRILSGLGQMYAADDRFKTNIDNAGGAGTAEFAAMAIEAYCAKNA